MRIVITILVVFIVGVAYSQPSQVAAEDVTLNLNERYKAMKSGSQTFKDYKVIKESVLDKVWKITTDSIQKKEAQLADAEKEIATLKNEVSSVNNSMTAQQASIKDVIYDSTHINVLGIPFSKGVFLMITAVLFGGMVFVLSVSMARVKMANSKVKEKTLIADSIGHEFEEFKKKSMEKQTKLSRELQNERNKWQEFRKA